MKANYVVEYKNSLTDPSWAPLETVAGDGQEQIVADLGPLPTARFYSSARRPKLWNICARSCTPGRMRR